MINRPDKHEYFMSIALMAAQRASCPRRKVGCVLVNNSNFILSTGYNGPPSGVRNCTEKPCGGQDHKSGEGLGSCIAIHAEMNALDQAKNRLHEVEAMYLTAGPCCQFCTESVVKIIQAGLMPKFKTIYFFDKYPAGTDQTFIDLGIKLVCLDSNLGKDSLLFQTAKMLGLRVDKAISRQSYDIYLLGGPAHGKLVTFHNFVPDSYYLESQADPDILASSSNSKARPSTAVKYCYQKRFFKDGIKKHTFLVYHELGLFEAISLAKGFLK